MKKLGIEVREVVDVLMDKETDVQHWVQDRSKKIRQILKLPGDASSRKYYRLFTDETSFILMKTESFEADGLKTPFIILQDHLSRSGIDVPTIIDVDASRGFILLEDLGDEVLLRRLQSVANSEVERSLYERVLDQLLDFQIKASPGKDNTKDLDAFRMKFDVEKLMWEVRFTIEHFYLGYLNRTLTDQDKSLIEDSFTNICEILANEPMVLAHRDFHSRNLMMKADRLVMIDFQDARMGNEQYDLASLLRDSYYQLEELQIDRLLDYFISRKDALRGTKTNREHFFYIFDLMSLQRNFKAIGSFASFLNRRGNPGYLKFIGNTFENIRRTLLKYPEFAPLREVLFYYYYF